MKCWSFSFEGSNGWKKAMREKKLVHISFISSFSFACCWCWRCWWWWWWWCVFPSSIESNLFIQLKMLVQCSSVHVYDENFTPMWMRARMAARLIKLTHTFIQQRLHKIKFYFCLFATLRYLYFTLSKSRACDALLTQKYSKLSLKFHLFSICNATTLCSSYTTRHIASD